MSKYKVYKIVNDRNTIYVGITTMSLKERKWKGYKWNEPLNAVYKTSLFEMIEETDDKSRENYWVEYHLNKGDKLLNMKRGHTDLSDSEVKRLWYNKNLLSKKESDKIRYENNKEEIKRKAREAYHKKKITKNGNN
jgi:hypothetical protein